MRSNRFLSIAFLALVLAMLAIAACNRQTAVQAPTQEAVAQASHNLKLGIQAFWSGAKTLADSGMIPSDTMADIDVGIHQANQYQITFNNCVLASDSDGALGALQNIAKALNDAHAEGLDHIKSEGGKAAYNAIYGSFQAMMEILKTEIAK